MSARPTKLAAQFKPKPSGEATGDVIPEWLPQSPFQPELFEPRTLEALRSRYSRSRPYPHVHIRNLGEAEAMKKVRYEILNYLTTDYRETDLFKVNQTMDLNNISAHGEGAKKTPYLMALRTHMYSEAFRNFLENVTGCGKLSDRVDCAANLYTSGSHLLCHDDVITTRKLSYIIYLSIAPGESNKDGSGEAGESEEGEWKPEYGGALELFDAIPAKALPPGTCASASALERAENEKLMAARACGNASAACDAVEEEEDSTPESEAIEIAREKGIVKLPLTVPGAVLQPEFNSMVVFEVKAGASFHAVQEVMTYDAKRISIQGWFHFAGPRPKLYDHGATLRLLQAPMLPLDPVLKDGANEMTCDSQMNLESKLPHQVNVPEEVQQKLLHDMEDAIDEKVYIDYSKQVVEFLSQDEQEKKSKLSETNEDEDDEEITSRTVKMFLSWAIKDAKERKAASVLNDNNDASAGTKSGDEHDEEDIEEDVWNDPDAIRRDLAFLRKFVNKQYTYVPVMQQIQSRFRRTGYLHLTSFLKPKLFHRVLQFVIKADLDEGLALAPNPEHPENKLDDEEEVGQNDCASAESQNDSDNSSSRYLLKPVYPPDYLVGINSFTKNFFESNGKTNDPQSQPGGTWHLAGPPFKKRFAFFQSPDSTLVAEFLREFAASNQNPDDIDAAYIFKHASVSQRAGLALDALNRALFQSTAFARLLQWLTCKTPLVHKTLVKRFRPGLDYTVGSYDELIDPDAGGTILDVSYTIVDEGQLDFSPFLWNSEKYSEDKEGSEWEPYDEANTELSLVDDDAPPQEDEEEEEDPEDFDLESEEEEEESEVSQMSSSATSKSTQVWKAENRIARRAALLSKKRSKRRLWRSDDHGGFNVHTSVDKTTEGDQAEEYVEGQGELLSLSARANSLSIVLKRPDTLTFVRYVNAGAPGSRWEIRSTVTCLESANDIVDESDEEDEMNEDEDGLLYEIDEDEDMMFGDGDMGEEDKILMDAILERGGYEEQDESNDE